MQHFASLQDVNIHGAWLTIGSFDGVHLGHQKILNALTAGAGKTGAPAVLLTFFPHPSVVLRGPRESFYLNTPQEKAQLLGDFGIHAVITHSFDMDISRLSARDFISNLKNHLGFVKLFVGYDFALGHDREGNVAWLRNSGREMGFEVQEFPPVEVEGEVVSSSLIRRYLGEGAIHKANLLLGRPFSLQGEVENGAGRGRTIGIPTANLAIWQERAVPGSGVYVCRAEVAGEKHAAVANIGVRPTFEEDAAPRVEAHILDFEGDIYGQNVRLEFFQRLRGEQRFESVDELVAQIETDITQAREILAQEERSA